MDKRLIIGLLIGFVVGGLFVGILDANRPTPLFSSAFMEEFELELEGDSNTNTNPNSNTRPKPRPSTNTFSE